MTFKEVIPLLLQSEGGYVNDPDDSGGETKFGISKRSYPSLDIKELTKEQAAVIYYNDYWVRGKCDWLPLDIRYIHFDTCVNSGVVRGAKLLQAAIGTVVVDGVIGSQTMAGCAELTRYQYGFERMKFYVEITLNKPTQVKFLKGWMKRLERVLNNQ